uniref:Uncharacterized protein n=1 Tax=Nelumbo nucifera TaxID=4432 RepID=A0A822YH73_NELNU|nr:TPA_asm: hypothetical protein HUJ06_009652 [Nelumbo nucifera]
MLDSEPEALRVVERNSVRIGGRTLSLFRLPMVSERIGFSHQRISKQEHLQNPLVFLVPSLVAYLENASYI